MSSPLPSLYTPRLLLRPLCISDYRDMFDYARLPAVTRFLLWKPHEDVAYTKRYLTLVQRLYREGQFHDFAVVDRTKKRMIGTCGFTTLDPDNARGEVGYVLHPDWWGMGLATEAARAVIAYGFHHYGLHRIEARYMAQNHASRRVMEKCGMQFEGIARGAMKIKGEFQDIGACAILREDFWEQFGRKEDPYYLQKAERKIGWW